MKKHRLDVGALVNECLELVQVLESEAPPVAGGRLSKLKATLDELKAVEESSGNPAIDASKVAPWILLLLESVIMVVNNSR